MWLLFLNLSIICLNHFLKVTNLFLQLSYLLVLYPSQCLTVHYISLLSQFIISTCCVSLVRITTATFPSHIPNVYYTNALIQSLSSKLKIILKISLLFLLIKNMHLLPLLSLLTHQILHVLDLPLLQHFLFHHIRIVHNSFSSLFHFNFQYCG